VDKVQPGRIIWGSFPRHGKNVGRHRGIILNTSAEIEAGEPLLIVVISSKLSLAKPEDMVILPSKAGGHPVTGLTKPSAAMCDWWLTVSQSDIAVHDLTDYKVYGTLLMQIAKRVGEMRQK
jgi:hypothetical protein